MFMGKGFAITSNLDLGKQLLSGYESARTRRTSPLPGIKIEAIANDSVATLLALMYRWQVHSFRKPAMGLIVGTGTNATIPLKLGMLHPSKHPEHLTSHSSTSTEFLADQKIIVNTEWTINGAVRPLQELHIITPWDLTLDAACDAPGFQPFEYMTGGRYLGELSRLIILDYFTTHLCIPASLLPRKLLTRNALTTSFLGSLSPHSTLLQRILEELPPPSSASTSPDHETFTWTQTTACLVYAITKSVQSRAAGLTAAATIGLLACAGDLSLSASLSSSSAQEIVSDNAIGGVRELIVGYTGGCIENFLDYLGDTQGFLDAIMGFVNAGGKYGNKGEGLRVLLKPVCDGGIIGAGVLAGMVRTSSTVAARTV
jgi:hexokinase